MGESHFVPPGHSALAQPPLWKAWLKVFKDLLGLRGCRFVTWDQNGILGLWLLSSGTGSWYPGRSLVRDFLYRSQSSPQAWEKLIHGLLCCTSELIGCQVPGAACE